MGEEIHFAARLESLSGVERYGRQASLTGVVSAKVEVSGVAMRRKLRVLLCSIIALAPKTC
jgi:hypothetical protein